MSSTACILTDNSVQFSQPAFAGRELIWTVPFLVTAPPEKYAAELRVSDLPNRWSQNGALQLQPPSQDILYDSLFSLTSKYDDVFVILSSSGLSAAYSNAQSACAVLQGRADIHLFDSQTISSGLGGLVQYAAALLNSGKASSDVEKLLRQQIPRVYSLLCPSTLSYLQRSGFVDEAQSAVNDLLGISPIFTLDEGCISPLEKSKSSHHLMEFFLEFIGEFEHITSISLIHPTPQQSSEMRDVRTFVEETYPSTQLCEHPINLPLAAMFGPKTTGLFLQEKAIN